MPNIVKPNRKLIPKGTDKQAKTMRRGIIISFLSQFKGMKLFCPCLNKNVEFNTTSVKETAVHASNSYESTLLVLDIEKAIILANKPLNSEKQPDTNTQLKERYTKMYILNGVLKGKKYKLVIGERKNKRIFHYCITKKDR